MYVYNVVVSFGKTITENWGSFITIIYDFNIKYNNTEIEFVAAGGF